VPIKRTCKLGDSDVHTLEDLTLILEILSRRFFLRLNLPDHSYRLNKANQILYLGPTSGIRAFRGTLRKKNHKITNKNSPTILYKMSQPANDEFSQHLSDDEESNHEDASDTGAAPKPQQQMIPQTTTILNIKLLILKKE
ncbi:hypothetical protein Tco_1534493, partial [Tanacetum coccineum]